ncbi:hypothetical protein Cgig2_011180 [Carnegiea gigantea]|uniref:Peptidase A2 domain-containing protein n=1 Tax=Carnegiea gigantea TaxID=171969 RepID=A0A9Q1JIJ4_9CARY|nr:hypothetical protein Cgig2_011180 [Carnegiea gigantea]
MEAAYSARPLPHFDYVPTTGCEPSHQRACVPFPYHTERKREASRSSWSGRSYTRNHDWNADAATRPSGHPERGQTVKFTTASTPYVLTTEQGTRVTVPAKVFSGREAPRFASPHNDPLVVEMKIASAIVRRILIDTGSSMDIITWDCLKKLMYPGRAIVPLVHTVLGFGGQEVNPIGMIRLPLCFADKLKARNLEVDFLVVDVPTTYNVILARPTLHEAKAEECTPPPRGPDPRPWPASVRRRNGGRPQSRRPLGVFEPTSPRPCVSIPLCPHDLVDSLAPWPWPPSRPPQKAPPSAGAAASSSCPPDHLSPPSASPSAVGTGSPAPQAFVAPSETIQRLSVARLALPLFEPLHRLYRLRHEFGDRPRLVILPDEVMEEAGRLLLLGPRHVIEAIPSQVPDLLGCHLDCMHQAECSGHTGKVAQLIGRDKGANVMPGRRHDLRRCQLVLSQNVFNHRVKRKPKVIREGRVVDRDALSRRLIHCCVCPGDHKSIPRGQERARTPGNSDPSATISRTGPIGELPLFLRTEIPEMEGPSWDDKLVDAPSEDERFDNSSEEEKDVSSKEELELVEPALAIGFEELGAEWRLH